MWYVKICNSRGLMIIWDKLASKEEAQKERDNLIWDHEFLPEDVFVEKC